MSSNDYQHYVLNEQRKRRIKLFLVKILVSALFIIPAYPFSRFLKNKIQKNILNAVHLKPDSDSFKLWCDPPVTAIVNYHLFNITNSFQIVTNPISTPIHIKDTPSYTYNIKLNKINIQWSNDNKNISYGVERLFTRHPTRFDPSSANDTGVFIDLLRATFRTQYQLKPTETFYDFAGMNTFYHRNAVEQLEGFTSDLFNMIKDQMVGPNSNKTGFVYRQNGSRLFNFSIQVGKTIYTF
ncbi:unnamed protein product [Rotaria sp. Silwood2]|nr:unnamed protein product [Rotaria sp. Silwood2]CAF4607536.1 unnamed protein product [Rotaria sp. Silwood2]